MKLFRFLFLFFLIAPIVELYFLLKVGRLIGAFPTLILLMAATGIGVILFRSQSLATVKKLRDTLAKGEVPALEMIEGPLLLFGAALLLIPGFLTDILGLFFLIPYTRRLLVNFLLRKHWIVGGMQTSMKSTQSGAERGITIEGDYKRED